MSERIGLLLLYTPDESVMSWFEARATGKRYDIEKAQKEYSKQIQDFVKKDLEKRGFKDITLRWSQRAGCSCGCTPGYIIKAKSYKKKSIEPYSARKNCKNTDKDIIKYVFNKGKLQFFISDGTSFVPPQGGRRGYMKKDLLKIRRLESFNLKLGLSKTIATTKEFTK